jgi:WD40 repeat protein
MKILKWQSRPLVSLSPLAFAMLCVITSGCSDASNLRNRNPSNAYNPTLFSEKLLLTNGQLLSVRDEKVPVLWDLKSGKEKVRFEGHTDMVNSVAMSPDGRCILTGGGEPEYVSKANPDNSARIWDATTGTQLLRFDGHGRYVTFVRFLSNGTRALSASAGGDIKVWEVGSGRVGYLLKAMDSGRPELSLSPDNSKLAVKLDRDRIGVWDAETGKQISNLRRPGEILGESMQFSPCAKFLVTTDTRDLHVWELAVSRVRFVCRGHTKSVNGIVLSDDGKYIASASHDGTVRLWDSASGRELQRFTHAGPVRDVLISAGMKYVLARWSNDPNNAYADNASLWEVSSGKQVWRIATEISQTVMIAGFSSDGSNVVITKNGHPSHILDSATGEVSRTFR